jgi:transcriptional regulator with XRE-family HTH domain
MLKDMAAALGVTPTYLSALEHGRRGKPNWGFVQRVIQYFNVIWDDAEELQHLAELSDPHVAIRTAGLSPKATLLANRLARRIGDLEERDLDAHLALLDRPRRRRRT